MILVTVELIPHGDESKAQVLHVGVIANSGTGTATRGNYRYALSQRGSKRAWRRGVVRDFPREAHGAWHLLGRALEDAIQPKSKGVAID